MRKAFMLCALLAVAGAAGAFVKSKVGDARDILRGQGGVYVLVEHLTPDAVSGGLNRDSIINDAELILRRSGVKVLTDKESNDLPNCPCLYINLNLYSVSGQKNLDVYSVDVQLLNTVRLRTRENLAYGAIVWHDPGVGSIGHLRLQELRTTIKDSVEKFTNIYLAANEKQ